MHPASAGVSSQCHLFGCSSYNDESDHPASYAVDDTIVRTAMVLTIEEGIDEDGEGEVESQGQSQGEGKGQSQSEGKSEGKSSEGKSVGHSLGQRLAQSQGQGQGQSESVMIDPVSPFSPMSPMGTGKFLSYFFPSLSDLLSRCDG